MDMARRATVSPRDLRARLAASEEELSRQALHDPLTDLPNRTLLGDRLERALSRTRRTGRRVGVLFLDLDRFKLVNDTRGHLGGDSLLKVVADRLTAAVRPNDTVARFGGDEFVVVCEEVCDAAEATALAERLRSALAEPIDLEGGQLFVTVSVGVAVSQRGDSPERLLRDADCAMYRAKERGRARTELFDETMRTKAQTRLSTELALRQALERDEFFLVYQPILSISDNRITGVEALLRWDRPDGIITGPAEFIPVAEETGLVVPIGMWVFTEACRQLATWRRTVRNLPPLTLSVNLSTRQLLEPELLPVLSAALTREGIEASALIVEITESVLMEDVTYFIEVLSALKSLGVRVAVDDFGTGYSSLEYLKRFPIDALKIDRTFVDGLPEDPHDSAIVTAIIAMARALGLSVVAEGVETAEQLATLRALGCDMGQGYHWSKPLPPDDLARLLTTTRSDRANGSIIREFMRQIGVPARAAR
jgi:diguanylate cyclase (GGDEF)-like protein